MPVAPAAEVIRRKEISEQTIYRRKKVYGRLGVGERRRRSRFLGEQIIAIVKEQEAGTKTADVCRKHGISDATFYKWTEPLRVCRRLQLLRRRSLYEQDDEQVCA